jgi:hypothetical protein
MTLRPKKVSQAIFFKESFSSNFFQESKRGMWVFILQRNETMPTPGFLIMINIIPQPILFITNQKGNIKKHAMTSSGPLPLQNWRTSTAPAVCTQWILPSRDTSSLQPHAQLVLTFKNFSLE